MCLGRIPDKSEQYHSKHKLKNIKILIVSRNNIAKEKYLCILVLDDVFNIVFYHHLENGGYIFRTAHIMGRT